MIRYCLISNGSNIICSFQPEPGSYEDVATKFLLQIDLYGVDKKQSFASENLMYHSITNDGIIYMCAADADFGRLKPYNFLNELKMDFCSGTLPMRAGSAGRNELNMEFQQTMSTLMDKHSHGRTGDAMSKLQTQVDEVKVVMSDNVEKVLERGERLDDLIDKTENLQDTSMQFNRTATRVRRKMWWQNIKTNLCIAGIVLAVILVVTLVILFSTGVLPPSPDADKTTTTTTPKSNGN